MTNKIITACASEIKKIGRFEPRFYYNQSLLKKTFDKFGYEEINDFATLKSGSTPKHYENKRNEEDCYFIESANVKRYGLNFSTINFVSSETHKSRIEFKVIPNDILLSSAGTIGFACLVPHTLKESSTNQNVIRIRLKDKSLTKFNPHFLVAFLNSQFGQIEMKALLTNDRYLNIKNFKQYKIPKIDEKTIQIISLKIQKAEKNEMEASLLLEQAKNFFYRKIGIDFSKIAEEKSYSVNAADFLKADLWSPKYLTSDLVNYEADQFPDFYVSEKIYDELNQDIKTNDVLFIKDGNNGMRSAMITKNDKIIISSHIVKLRLKIEAKKHNFTPEYLFLVLSLKEIGFYSSIRRTVIASTLPCLREDKLKEIEIPILDKNSIGEITELVKRAFELKDEKKGLIKEVQKEIDDYFQI
ncbi:29312_t:CDS:2 [Racocetra persica]|uniref:29312_t:CDS:1 n=1 Tax=Racocetra persica TaxID=160502 RepID=A0ACA9LH02_9GLOM|nr:29312_t:CDS:2 [Racocetra persica]